MKNIWVIPTDKPSRLYEYNGVIGTIYSPNPKITLESTWRELKRDLPKHQALNIYITSDEEIKEGDRFFTSDHNGEGFRKYKIILTTDQDLIDLGVQSIDDEFLQWYIKNPSCEEAKVEITCITPNFGDVDKYRIAIPKEEQKQHLIDMMKADEELGLYEEPKQITGLDGDGLGGIPKGILTMLIGKKEETLEQAAESYKNQWLNEIGDTINILDIPTIFKTSAKWQQERMYSEVEVLQLLLRLQETESYNNLYEWFNQFKK